MSPGVRCSGLKYVKGNGDSRNDRKNHRTLKDCANESGSKNKRCDIQNRVASRLPSLPGYVEVDRDFVSLWLCHCSRLSIFILGSAGDIRAFGS